MKYIIKNSDLFLSGKLIPEGTEIELSEVQTKGIESYLSPLTQTSHSESDLSGVESDSKNHPEQVYAEQSRSIEGSENKNEIKSKSKGNKK